ncbi:TPA: hypothetical protein ACH3X3_001130 [Trebouxia sp. C0006]
MKRKHDTVVDGRRAAKTADAHRLPTNEQSPQNLQQQDLATERRYMGPKGWCLLAKQQARARSLVMEYIGEVITKAEAQQRTKVYDDEEIQALHLLHLSPSTVIDATRTGNDARYMAHSQDPNCQCQKWVVDNQPRAFMVALRDIAPGEELTYNYYRQCSLGEQVRCLCGAARCHSNQGTPVLQSQSETERMADAVLKCIQETTFGSVQDLQANDQTAPPARSQVSTPPYAKQLPLCTVSPSAFCSPPPATREDINALGLDSPDSFLDQLHRTSAKPVALQVIAARCRTLLTQLPDASAAQQHATTSQQPGVDHVSKARHADSGAVLASAADVVKPASKKLMNDPPAQQHLPGRLSNFTDTQQAAPQVSQSPSRQAAYQLAAYLAQHKDVIVGGYAVALQDRQLQKPAPSYRRMQSLKSVLAARLQAGTSLPTDPASLLEEAGWQPHLLLLGRQPKGSPVFGAGQMPSPPNRSPAFGSSPLGPAALLPQPKNGTQLVAVGARQLAAMQAPAGIRKNGPHGSTSLSPPSTATTVSGQQQSGEAPAVPPVDAVLGTLPPPNTPEGLQSCQAGVNSTLKTLGLSQDQIHQILRNAEALTTDFGLKVPVL